MYTLEAPVRRALGVQALQLLRLADVGAKSDDLGAVGLLEPPQNDRRVQSTRVRQYDLHFSVPNARRAKRRDYTVAPTGRKRARRQYRKQSLGN